MIRHPAPLFFCPAACGDLLPLTRENLRFFCACLRAAGLFSGLHRLFATSSKKNSESRFNTAQAAFVSRRKRRNIPGGGELLARNPRYSNRNARNALRRRVAAQGLPCHLCGQPIDYSLPAGHPLAFELDEIIPLAALPEEQRAAAAIDPRNVAPAHRICNERRGCKPLSAPVVRGMRLKTSDDW